VNSLSDARMKKVCRVCGAPHYAKGLCRKHYEQLPEVKEKHRAYRHRPEVKEKHRAYIRAYYHRPEVKEKHRAYNRAYRHRPEVKEKHRAYNRAYRQRPEVKEKHRAYYHRPEVRAKAIARMEANFKRPIVPVIDCFNKDKPITLEELCKRSGGGKTFVLIALRNYKKLGLVLEPQKNLFHLNHDSPYRMAVDGYFRENEHKPADKERKP
jgi:hypothetical protein